MVLAIVGRVTFPAENSDIGVDGDDCVVVDDDDVGNLTTILRANDTMHPAPGPLALVHILRNGGPDIRRLWEPFQ